MSAGRPDPESTLPVECQRALEAWVCDDPATSGAVDHLERCPSCRELADAIRLDQELLRWQLSRIEAPPPRTLALREPLRAASGHPRRVSLAVLPFILALLLVLALAVELGVGHAGRMRHTRDQLRRIDRALATAFPSASEGIAELDRSPAEWARRLHAAAPELLEGIARAPDGALLDPYGGTYRLRGREGGWEAFSTGPDRQPGGGDDIAAEPR